MISVCGSDEHGVPITIKARKEGVTPQQIVDRYHNLIKKSFEGLGMSFDIYSRTSSATHAATASEFFRKLYDEGKFIEKTSMQYYDEEAQTFLGRPLYRRHLSQMRERPCLRRPVRECGSTLSPDELIDPHSAVSGSVPVKGGDEALVSRRWTDTKASSANGFSMGIRSGKRMFTDSARAGSTADCFSPCREP